MSKENDNGRSLVVQVSAVRAAFLEKKENVFAAAASHIKPERFIELVARSCMDNPVLLECTRVSLFESAAEAARLGLELGGVLGQAYLIPYKQQGILESQLVLGYKGYKELAYRSEKVSVIDAGTVRPGDSFEYMRGTDQYIKHRPRDEANAEWTHVWAFGKTIHGEPIIHVMSMAQVEAHRNKFAPGWNRRGSAWLSNPEAMGEKTCLHRVSRKLPLSPEYQQVIERSEYIEHGAGFSAALPLLSGEAPPAEDVDALKKELASEGTSEEEGPQLDAQPDNSNEPTPEELRRDGLLI